MHFYTIGYEGLAQETLLHTLLVNEVQTLLDIRELPLSRKPGFSKTALGSAVNRVGIGYAHLRALGTPRDLRHQRKIDHDEAAFRQGYLDYLATQDEAVESLIMRLQKERCCLLCYEADAQFCHRLLVAQWVQDRVGEQGGGAVTITHLQAE